MLYSRSLLIIYFIYSSVYIGLPWCVYMGFPGGVSGKEPVCQCRRHRRHRFNPWVGKIPWWRKWQPTSLFLPGKIPWTERPGGLHMLIPTSWFIPLLIFPSLIAELVKHPPSMPETLVRFLGQEDPLEKGLATHSSILVLPLWLSW